MSTIFVISSVIQQRRELPIAKLMGSLYLRCLTSDRFAVKLRFWKNPFRLSNQFSTEISVGSSHKQVADIYGSRTAAKNNYP